MYRHLPLVAALLLAAHIRFLSSRTFDGLDFLFIAAHLLFECLPLFAAHHLAANASGPRALVIWLFGFIVYPLASLGLARWLPPFADWSLFSVQDWLLLLGASVAWFINRARQTRNATRSMRFISKFFSLNVALLLLSAGWALVMAGIMNSHIDPMLNQPLIPKIDTSLVLSEFGRFLGYLWQFLVLATLMLSVYGLNRYVLIRRVLAGQGVLAFVVAALISLIVLTPLFGQVVLALPINAPADVPFATLLPSSDRNVFAPFNYHFMLGLLLLSTPVILAFERQQSDARLAQIAQRQIRTELKLLQQQINPHFLFNTLNNLYALTLTKSEKAPDLVMQLANLLRYTVYEGQKEKVTLAQEIAYLQDYIALQQIRSGDKCALDEVWPEHGDKYTLPPLLLIILLENAFKYGVEPSVDKCRLRIDCRLEGGSLYLLCENPVSAEPEKDASGVGLENLRRRLELLYPDRHTLKSEAVGDIWHAELHVELTPC